MLFAAHFSHTARSGAAKVFPILQSWGAVPANPQEPLEGHIVNAGSSQMRQLR